MAKFKKRGKASEVKTTARFTKVTLDPELPSVSAYTAGYCCKNTGGNSGFASVTVFNGEIHKKYAGFFLSSKHRMSLYAIISVLESYGTPHNIVIHSDNEYVIKALSLWIGGWITNGWLKIDGEPVKHRDLFEQILLLQSIHNVQYAWISRKSGHALNKKCHALSETAAQKPSLEDIFQLPD